MLQNVQDVLMARLTILVMNEKLEAGEANIAVRAIKVLVENSDADELVTALENAMWMDKTILEDENGGEPIRPVREGVDNDGLTDAEATEALDEQAAWPQDEFGREIDPVLLVNNRIAMFAKVNGAWRFEGFMGEAHIVIAQPVAEFKKMVEAENGPGTAFVVKLPS